MIEKDNIIHNNINNNNNNNIDKDNNNNRYTVTYNTQ